jgi:hypothetical protein
MSLIGFLLIHDIERSTKKDSVLHRTGFLTSFLVRMLQEHRLVHTSFAIACHYLSSFEIGIFLLNFKCSISSRLIISSLKYALTAKEVQSIVMQRLIRVDAKVRTDPTFPAGFMDVITIEKTGENFRLVYDTKGRFAVHRITAEEAEYKLGKVKRVQLGRGGVPYLVTHDART